MWRKIIRKNFPRQKSPNKSFIFYFLRNCECEVLNSFFYLNINFGDILCGRLCDKKKSRFSFSFTKKKIQEEAESEKSMETPPKICLWVGMRIFTTTNGYLFRKCQYVRGARNHINSFPAPIITSCVLFVVQWSLILD